MSNFAEADIGDMSSTDKEQENWLANFILNSVLRATFHTPQRHLANREGFLGYIGSDPPLGVVLSCSWQAYCFLGQVKRLWFKRDDGSVHERLNALYNRANHADQAIERGDFIEDGPLCVWLTNDGLKSTETKLSFAECAEILEDLARAAAPYKIPYKPRSFMLRGYRRAMANKEQRESLIRGLEEADRVEHELDAKDLVEDGERLDKIAEQLGAPGDEAP
jgi:hypothetical protein